MLTSVRRRLNPRCSKFKVLKLRGSFPNFITISLFTICLQDLFIKSIFITGETTNSHIDNENANNNRNRNEKIFERVPIVELNDKVAEIDLKPPITPNTSSNSNNRSYRPSVPFHSHDDEKKEDEDERSTTENYDSQNQSAESRVSSSSSSSSVLLNPIGIWKRAKKMVQEGVHRFRESLHEGVKVAQMLKEDVDEGVAHLLPSRKSKHNKNGEIKLSSTTMKGDTEAFDNDETEAEVDTDHPSNNEYTNKFSEDELNRVIHNFGQQLPREGVLGGILKFIGVDSSSIGIILLNILIFVAEMETSSLLGKDASTVEHTRMLKENLLEWVVTGHNEKVSKIIAEGQSHELPEHIIQTLQKKTGVKTACVQLLICKMSPFIWGIQKTVDKELQLYKNNDNGTDDPTHGDYYGRSNEDSDFRPRSLSSYFSTKYLGSVWSELLQVVPDRYNFLTFGDNCEKKFPACKLLKFKKTDKKNSS